MQSAHPDAFDALQTDRPCARAESLQVASRYTLPVRRYQAIPANTWRAAVASDRASG